MKKINVLIIILSILFLVGCHKNPLKTSPKTKSCTFLIGASTVAERGMRLGIMEGFLGSVYAECMEGEQAKNIDCRRLYQAMLVFAKSGKYPAFKNITLADLTDKTVFDDLRDRYETVLSSTDSQD